MAVFGLGFSRGPGLQLEAYTRSLPFVSEGPGGLREARTPTPGGLGYLFKFRFLEPEPAGPFVHSRAEHEGAA